MHQQPTATREFVLIIAMAWMSASAWGQSGADIFAPGNLVLARTVYAGDSTTVSVGQPLPPICPATATCAPITASDNGAYPAPGSTNNVWNNAKADGNFGVTSPIFLDQITPVGTLVNTLAVPPNMIVTSFSSKSELAVNLSQDGTSLTFMGYVAPVNGLDISKSNTPGAYDPTNPSGGSYFRAVAQVGANGAVQITPVSAYSGDAGRAAILANGVYYMAGNSNNGSGTPANIAATTGVQAAVPGQPAPAPTIQVGFFTIEQVTNPSTGKPYPPDKFGKDDNFRGLTIFKNTLYVTKGSGSNGINTVYQVGSPGNLPNLGAAASTPITILPGFPTTLARSSGAAAFFGLWFANANTLYVADEGDGTVANAATSKTAGLQKWSLVNGLWQLDYVLQNGLNLGQPYNLSNYPPSISPGTDGLRNIIGRANGDGTVTIWAITSTLSLNGDQGADPNKLVAITDVLANRDPSAAVNEQFITLRTAQAGEVLRGVSFTPQRAFMGLPMASVPLILSAANPGATAIAPGSLAFALGQRLANTTSTPGQMEGSPPTDFAGTSITIIDSVGKSFEAPLLFVSPAQITFMVPEGVASGLATVKVTSPITTQAASNIQVSSLAPGLFTLNNAGLASGDALRLSPDGTRTPEQIFNVDAAGTISAKPIDLGDPTDNVYLTLYGTGLRTSDPRTTKVTVNGITVPMLYAGPQGSYAGLDQINLSLPQSLAGTGNVNIQLSAGEIAANPVQITIK